MNDKAVWVQPTAACAWTRRQWLAGAAASGFASCATAQGLPTAWPAPALFRRVDWPSLRLIDGSMLAAEEWLGRPAIVVIWATWCAFCKRHNAHIDRLFQALTGSGPRVLGVAMDGDVASVKRYMQVNGYRFPVALNEGRLRRRFTDRRVVPMTCLVDRAGRLLQCIPGEMAEDDVMGLGRVLAS